MDIKVISIFPEMFASLTEFGVSGRAIDKAILSLSIVNPRDFAPDARNTVDDRPYGGGPGMVMTPAPLVASIKEAKKSLPSDTKVVYLSPKGEKFNQSVAVEWARKPALILLAGRYEGVDERVIKNHVDEEWSVGDFVLSGGELPAMMIIDALARLLPDSLGNAESAQQDSFSDGLLDCPHYTRPEVFEGESVPSVLTSGDHQAIERWRLKQSIGQTWLNRPDLLNKLELTDLQRELLAEFKREL